MNISELRERIIIHQTKSEKKRSRLRYSKVIGVNGLFAGILIFLSNNKYGYIQNAKL